VIAIRARPVALLGLVLLTGCGGAGVAGRASVSPAVAASPGSSLIPPSAAPTVLTGGSGGNDDSFLEVSPSDVAFVRWTDNHGSLVGTFDYVKTDSTKPTGTSTTEESLTGVRDGDHVSLMLNEGLGTGKTLTGSLMDSGGSRALALTIPQPDGQLADARFSTASVNDYNAAVASLSGAGQAQAQADVAASAEAAGHAASQATQSRLDRAVADADATLGNALGNLAHALATLAHDDVSFKTSLAEAASALAQTRKDYATEQHDATNKPPDCGQIGSDDGTVQSDLGSTQSGQGSVESDTAGVSGDADQVASALSQAQGDLAALQQAEQADPQQTAVHSAGDLTAPADQATTLVKNARNGISKATTTAQNDVDAAQGVAAHADALSRNCTG